MRYDNWDVLLFPTDSHVPIQEFKTACYTTRDECGLQNSALACYISSLPPSTPFRISIHLWDKSAKPSAFIESLRKSNEKVVYTTQVIIDGRRVFHSCFDSVSTWPQEIVHERRSITPSGKTSGQRKRCIEFPAFQNNVLLQSSWNARDNQGRIKVVLSEQLVSQKSKSDELKLGAAHEIICFSFQHAPRDILEQVGIAWPIRNPLYLLPEDNSGNSSLSTSLVQSRLTSASGVPTKSSSLSQPWPPSTRPINPEPYGSSTTGPPSQFMQCSRSSRVRQGATTAGMWDDSFEKTFHDMDDAPVMARWPMKGTPSTLTDIGMADYMLASPRSAKLHASWDSSTTRSEKEKDQTQRDSNQNQKDRKVLLALRDDQLGQIIEAISPSKISRKSNGHLNARHSGLEMMSTDQQRSHVHFPPQLGAMPTTKPRGLFRTASHTEVNSALQSAEARPPAGKSSSSDTNKIYSPSPHYPSISSNKENRPPSQSRVPTPYPYVQNVPTANPLNPVIGSWDFDMPVKTPSSAVSGRSRMQRSGAPPPGGGRCSPALATAEAPKSRKEGLKVISPRVLGKEGNDNKNAHRELSFDTITATKDLTKEHNRAPRNTPILSSPEMGPPIDITNVSGFGGASNVTVQPATINAESLSFIPSHKPGTSSLDSTARLERQLFSALGEELGGFGEGVKLTQPPPPPPPSFAKGSSAASALMVGDLADAESERLLEFEPVAKRKRQGTLGAGRTKSPDKKREKGDVEAWVDGDGDGEDGGVTVQV